MVEVTEQYIAEMKAKITALQSSLKEKEEVNRGLQNACDSWAVICEELKAENERLSGLLVSLSNGEAMNVVRESEGVYSVIFKTPKANP